MEDYIGSGLLFGCPSDSKHFEKGCHMSLEMSFLLLLIISLYPIPTSLGAFIDKAVEKRVEGTNPIHHLSCDTSDYLIF
jgi:hypothetical protein